MELMNLGDCAQEAKCPEPYGLSRRPSMKENLEHQKSELEARLQRINAALDALNAHPEVMKVLELVSKV